MHWFIATAGGRSAGSGSRSGRKSTNSWSRRRSHSRWALGQTWKKVRKCCDSRNVLLRIKIQTCLNCASVLKHRCRLSLPYGESKARLTRLGSTALAHISCCCGERTCVEPLPISWPGYLDRSICSDSTETRWNRDVAGTVGNTDIEG